ncbi:hypothetical protein ACQY0O_007436 [Thecaphora frezii]
MDSLSNLRNSLDDSDYNSLRNDGTDIASIERKRRQKHLGDHEQELTKQFKAAALQLTTLYRSSLSSNKSSYEAGYRHALSHVLELIVRSPVATDDRQEQQQQDAVSLEELTPEQSVQRLRWLAGYLQRRIEAMSTQDDDDDNSGSSMPSAAPATPMQSTERARPARFEGPATAHTLRQQLHRGSSSPGPAASSLSAPLPPATRFTSNLASSSNSPVARSGFATPIASSVPAASAATSASGSTASASRTTEPGSSSGKTAEGVGRSLSALTSLPAPVPPQSPVATQAQRSTLAWAAPTASSSSGIGLGTKRGRGEGNGNLSNGSGAGLPTSSNVNTASSHVACSGDSDGSPLLDPATTGRRRISGRKSLVASAAASLPSHLSGLSASGGIGSGPTLGLPATALRSSSFDFKLPQSVGVRNVDFSHPTLTTPTAVTAAKLHAGKRHAGGAAATAMAKRVGTSPVVPRRNRPTRLRSLGGLRSSSAVPSSSVSADDMATDSEDDWVDDADEGEQTAAGAATATATASGGSGQGVSRHAHARGGGSGRAKRRRTGRVQDGLNGEEDRDGSTHEAAGDVDM